MKNIAEQDVNVGDSSPFGTQSLGQLPGALDHVCTAVRSQMWTADDSILKVNDDEGGLGGIHLERHTGFSLLLRVWMLRGRSRVRGCCVLSAGLAQVTLGA